MSRKDCAIKGLRIIELGELAEPLAVAAEEACPSARVNTLARRPEQRDALRHLLTHVPGGAGVVEAIRAALSEAGAVVVRDVPVGSDTLLVLLGAAAAAAVTSEVTGEALIDQVTTAAVGEDTARAQNQRSEMLLHTDASAQQLPPKFIGLACVANEGNGGGSLLLDIDEAVAALKAVGDEDSLAQLEQPFPFVHPLHRDKQPAFAPVLTRRSGDGFRVRYRKENLDTGLELAGDTVTAGQRAALNALAAHLDSGTCTIELRLSAGDYLLIDNTRFLHGRSEIDPGARRLLKRIYFGDVRETA